MNKGDALRAAAAELEAGALVFAGDDLGDVEAFRAVAALREGGLPGRDEGALPGRAEGALPGRDEGGLPGLLVCSGSEEQEALVELADLVVDGPAGVVDFLRRLTADLSG